MYRYFLIAFLLFSNVFAKNVLQEAIDNASAGAILKLSSGIYKGGVTIDKPLTIIGKEDNVIIDAQNKGTGISIKSSFVTIKNIKIINSGSLHHHLDAGISLKECNNCEITNCIIENCLFGIDLQMVNNSIVSNNYITSKDVAIGLRGDGIRLWYSHDNVVKKNSLIKSRDMVIWYSHGNQIVENYGEYCRYSLHFMYAGKNYVRNNSYKFNSVGIFFMYSNDSIATGNVIKSSLGATGIGLGLKDVSNFTIKDNTIIYCARGLYIDRSPFEPDTTNIIENNKILYNSEALHFHSISENNTFKYNTVMGNIEDVVNDSRGAKTYNNTIESNYWDNYKGFDKNKDNIGDTPHKVYQYADQMWVFNPNVKFFYGSPVISLLNFLGKLAPFSKPLFLMEDKKPKLKLEG